MCNISSAAGADACAATAQAQLLCSLHTEWIPPRCRSTLTHANTPAQEPWDVDVMVAWWKAQPAQLKGKDETYRAGVARQQQQALNAGYFAVSEHGLDCGELSTPLHVQPHHSASDPLTSPPHPSASGGGPVCTRLLSSRYNRLNQVTAARCSNPPLPVRPHPNLCTVDHRWLHAINSCI
jgi:hypothetical protein